MPNEVLPSTPQRKLSRPSTPFKSVTTARAVAPNADEIESVESDLETQTTVQ